MDAGLSYREAAVQGASPVKLVVLLYEQMVEDLRRAARAIDENRIEVRTKAIDHAMLIVSHLQNELNLEAGGGVARNLERFYNLLRTQLLEAQIWVSKDILNEQISLLLDFVTPGWWLSKSRKTGRLPKPVRHELHPPILEVRAEAGTHDACAILKPAN